jgi:hypothetical protein
MQSVVMFQLNIVTWLSSVQTLQASGFNANLPHVSKKNYLADVTNM